MNSDHYFYIGKSHNVNQDYSISGEINGTHYCIVCDGCSGSPDTDIGARLLARSALSYIDRIHSDAFQNDVLHDLIISKAAMQAKALDLHPRALDATLLIASFYKDTFYVKMYGDGCSIIKFTDGTMDIHEVEFPQNAPYYLNYLARDSQYIEEYKQYIGKFKYTDLIHIDGAQKNIREKFAPEKPSDMWKDLGYPKDSIQFIALMSDGVKSFDTKKISNDSITNENVDHIEIINELTSFKNTKGEFVKRRVHNALKTFASNDIHHKDDLSVAVLYNDE